MAAPTISYSKTSTATKYGGDALNNVNNYLNGVNVTSVIGTPIIRTPTKIPSDILIFTDPAEDNTVTVKIPSISANRNINLIPSNVIDNDEVLYKDTVQTISGKVISAGTNTITGLANSNLSGSAGITDANLATITDKAKQHTQTAYLDNSQTFTQAQSVSVASATPLTARNATSTVGATVGVQLHMRDSGGTNTVYSKAESRIVTNTDTSEEGAYDIWLVNSGTLRQQLSLVDEQLQIGRIGERIVFDTSGISSSSKTITWANLAGTPALTTGSQTLTGKTINGPDNTVTNLGDSSIAAHTSTKITITDKTHLPSTSVYTTDAQELTTKTQDFRQNTFLRRARYGSITPDNPDGQGNLKNMNVMGDDGGISSNTAGRYRILNTTATAGDWCGYAKLDNYTCRRSGAPLLRWAFLYKTAGSKRRFTGLKATKGIVTTTSNSAPLGSGEAGFMFGYGIGDTEWQIFYNDSSGTCNKEALTGITIPGADTNYIVEMAISNAASGSFSISFFNVNSDGSKGSQIGSTVTKSTTEIPGSTTDLYYNDILVSTGTAVLPHTLHYMEIEN